MAEPPRKKDASLDAFRIAAKDGGRITVVSRNGGISLVGSKATTKAAGIAWKPVDDPAVVGDAVRLFMTRLRESYGTAVGATVAREIGLDKPGDGLAAADVERAIDMAATAHGALAGVNFISRHAVSASSNSPEFRLVCQVSGIDPGSLSPLRRQLADQLFGRSFDAAADGDRRCVDLPEARQLMVQALRTALAMDDSDAQAALAAPRAS
jgi:hypothetical protein